MTAPAFHTCSAACYLFLITCYLPSVLLQPDHEDGPRMGGRRTCPACGESFHVVYKAPRKENICDRCGGPLTIRDDDKEEVVKNRLVVYHKNTQPLISYYEEKGKLRRVDGTRDIGEVHEEIAGLL